MRSWSLTQKILVPTLLAIGVCFGALLWMVVNTTHENDVESEAANAKATILQFKSLRAYYTENVAAKMKGRADLRTGIDHDGKPDVIPLPATMIHDMSRILGQDSSGIFLKLYSAFPFPNRKDRPVDGFMREAMEHLGKDPSAVFMQIDGEGDGRVLRVAIADLMVKQACVDCHNAHPESPKRDWKVGDVRGILEVDKPLRAQLAASRALFWKILAVFSVCIGVLVALVVLLTRFAVVKPLLVCAQSLGSGGEQIASASGQVSQSSQGLADGASTQASSLEETSASLEELSAGNRENSDRAREADAMAKEVRADAEGGKQAMERMGEAIGRIKQSADQTAGILRSIDEIAFQTNLLALNAAVEAARAGDAGKGFAVVAEEVRSLARRSAEAAKNTAALIEESQRNAQEGITVSSEATLALSRIAQKVQGLARLIGEVAAASAEQSKGLEQIGNAMASMDAVTQANAAASEESASASEELFAQAQELEGMVETLVGIVKGAGAKAAGTRAAVPRSPSAAKPGHASGADWSPRPPQRVPARASDPSPRAPAPAPRPGHPVPGNGE